MRFNRTLFVRVALGLGLLLALLLKPLFHRQSAAGLEWTGRTAENYSAFMFSLTNRSLGPEGALRTNGFANERIQFEWVDGAGSLGTCHADLYRRVIPDDGVMTAYIAIPPHARKVRVLLCSPPGPGRKNAQDLVGKLPWALQRLVPGRWRFQHVVHSPLLPWTTNPALQAAAAAPGR